MSLAAAGLQAAPSGGLCVLGVPLVLLDSITESGPQHRGAVLVTCYLTRSAVAPEQRDAAIAAVGRAVVSASLASRGT